MALTANLTKKSVSLVQKDLWAVIFNFILLDGVIEVLNKDFSVNYRTGQTISYITQKFVNLIQEEINKYKSEQVIFNHPQLDNVVTAVKNNLIL